MKTINHFQCRQVQIFENDTNKSKLYARRNYDHIYSGNICFYFAHCYLKTYRLQYIKTKILSVVFIGVQLRTLTLKDEHGQGNSWTRCWGKHVDRQERKLYKTAENYIRKRMIKAKRMRFIKHVARKLWEYKCKYGFKKNPRRKVRAWNSRKRWEDNIKMDFTETGLDSLAMTNLGQKRYGCEWQVLVNTVMNLQIL